jgi:hypothetical protein
MRYEQVCCVPKQRQTGELRAATSTIKKRTRILVSASASSTLHEELCAGLIEDPIQLVELRPASSPLAYVISPIAWHS